MPRTSRAAVVGLLGVFLAGCGNGAGGAASTPTSPSPSPSTSASTSPETRASQPDVDVSPYLLRAEEVPGLTPVSSPITYLEPPFDLPEGGAAVLESSGYISTTYQPAEGDTSAGVSSVLLFETEDGAGEWMAYETSDATLAYVLPDSELERFQVPGIPGAHGFTGPDLHGNAIGQVYWTQGRCMLLIGLEVEGPRVERLSAGARAIYERTGGTCPD